MENDIQLSIYKLFCSKVESQVKRANHALRSKLGKVFAKRLFNENFFTIDREQQGFISERTITTKFVLAVSL